MSRRADTLMTAAAVLLLLFSAMLDPRVSLVLAVALLAAFAVYMLVVDRRTRRR